MNIRDELEFNRLIEHEYYAEQLKDLDATTALEYLVQIIIQASESFFKNTPEDGQYCAKLIALKLLSLVSPFEERAVQLREEME